MIFDKFRPSSRLHPQLSAGEAVDLVFWCENYIYNSENYILCELRVTPAAKCHTKLLNFDSRWPLAMLWFCLLRHVSSRSSSSVAVLHTVWLQLKPVRVLVQFYSCDFHLELVLMKRILPHFIFSVLLIRFIFFRSVLLWGSLRGALDWKRRFICSFVATRAALKCTNVNLNVSTLVQKNEL